MADKQAGYSLQAVDLDAITESLTDVPHNGVINGLTASVTGTDLNVTVAAGTARGNGVIRSPAQTVIDFTGDPDGTNPRKALIVMDSTGTVVRRLGTAEAADPVGSVRRNSEKPSTPEILTDDVVLHEVWLGTGATTIAAADVTDRRIFSIMKRLADVRIATEFITGAWPAGTDADPYPGSAIQAAIDDLPTIGGIVFVPVGVWDVSTGLTITQSGVTLTGSGYESTQLKYTGASGFCITMGDGVTRFNRITVRNLEIILVNNATRGMKINSILQGKVENVHFDSTLVQASNTDTIGILLTGDITGGHRNSFWNVRMLKMRIGLELSGVQNVNDTVIMGGHMTAYGSTYAGSIALNINRGDTVRVFGLSTEDYETHIRVNSSDHYFYGLRCETGTTGILLTSSSFRCRFFGGSTSNMTTDVNKSGTNHRFSMMRLGAGEDPEIKNANVAIDATGVIESVIPHGLPYTPARADCQISLARVAGIQDFALDWVMIISTDATNVTIRTKVGTASATGGATVQLNVRIATELG